MSDLAEQILGRAGLAIGDTLDLSELDHVGERLYTLTLTIAAGTFRDTTQHCGRTPAQTPQGPLRWTSS